MPEKLIVAHGDVVTMNPTRDVLLGGSVVIDGSVLLAVGPTTTLLAEHPDARVIDARGCVVTPGMINAHQHFTGGPLVRSCIPDLLASGESIFSWSVPIHGAHSPDDDEVSADGQIHDVERTQYIREHLAAVHDAISAGVDVRGYYLWSLLDNFEWAYGYSKRFGIVRVDFDSQKRTVKDSGRFYSRVVQANALPDA